MRDSFNKFKNRIILEILIKCIVIGFSLGLIVVSVPLIIVKVKGIDFKVLYLILIGLGVMLLISGLLFLIFKPSDKKIAKRIDNNLNLNEKVQTMIEFENEDGKMINLQREHTLKILANTSIKELTIKISVFLIVLLGLALSTTVAAIAIPAHEEPFECITHTDNNNDGICDVCGESVPYDPNYDIDDWTILSILQIIEKVQASTIDESLKTKYVSELNNLITTLKSAEKESEMKEVVIDLIELVRFELDKVNTNNEVYTVLRTTDTSSIKTLAEAINYLKLDNVKNALEGFIILISGKVSAITEIDNSFGQILRTSNLNKQDSLYLALIEFATKINECKNAKLESEANDEYSDTVNEAVKQIVKDYSQNVISILEHQRENYDVALYIEEELIKIFGLTEEEIGNNDNVNDDNQDGDSSNNDGYNNNDDLENGNSGGLGTGEVLFGSNEAFFDPEKGVVVYGDVITDYYSDIFTRLEEGTLPDDFREYFNNYYDSLFNAQKEEEN